MSDSRPCQLGEFTCTVVHCASPEEALAPPVQGRCLAITDRNCEAALGLQGRFGDDLRILPPGEDAKAWDQVQSVLAAALDRGMARDDWFMGIGGGVITDMSAFAASLYLRGCRLILVPTTLLAMVDAAFGGKTGINFGGYKNMVGTFYPAVELRICPSLLASLPEREYLGGLGEVIKSAALDDAELWKILKDNVQRVLARDPALVDLMVRRSLAVKARIVETDFREENIRAHLNLGHTFAHALEAVAGLGTWSHGEAVAWGMVKACQLSARLGLCSQDWAQEMRAMVEAYGFRTTCTCPAEALLAAMKVDKKKKGGAVRFVLQEGLCRTLTQKVDDGDILAVLALD